MKQFPFISASQMLIVLRVVLGLMMMAHGAARLYVNSIADFGKFLDSKGFMIGTILAWMITLFDLIGGATLAFGYLRKIICAGFIFVLMMGIFLVHLPNGWFVVGHQSGGIEFSVLLIICFILIASTDKKL
jgi:putative oxidoreductase